MPVPLMPAASLAGPPSAPGAKPGRVIPVPLIVPPEADVAGRTGRTALAGPGPSFARPTGAVGIGAVTPECAAMALALTLPLRAPAPVARPRAVALVPAGWAARPIAFLAANAGTGADACR